MLTVLIDPDKIADPESFAQQTEACLQWVTASPPQAGVERVLVAGEPERRSLAQRSAGGIPVDETTWQEILNAGEKLGISADAVSRHVGNMQPAD